MGVDMLLQPRFAGHHLGHVARRTDDARFHRHFGEGERAALSRDDGKAFAFYRLVLRARGSGEIALRFLQRHLFVAGGVQIGGARRRQKSAIAPDQRQSAVAQPYRNGQGIEHGAEIRGRRRRSGLGFDPNGRHAADRAAAHTDGALQRVVNAQGERRAAFAEIVERRGQLCRLRALQAGISRVSPPP